MERKREPHVHRGLRYVFWILKGRYGGGFPVDETTSTRFAANQPSLGSFGVRSSDGSDSDADLIGESSVGWELEPSCYLSTRDIRFERVSDGPVARAGYLAEIRDPDCHGNNKDIDEKMCQLSSFVS